MSGQKNYLKILMEIADQASKTYSKYQEYQNSPNDFKEKDPNLHTIFKMVEMMTGTVKEKIKSNDSETNNQSYSNKSSSGNIRELHYKNLECSFLDTNDVIKNNYKKMAKKFHPDSISSKDLPDEFIQFASTKFKEIRISYEYIRRERDF